MKAKFSEEKIYRVTADHFCAGVIVQNDRIIKTAPILSWLRGKQFAWLQYIASFNCWKIEKVAKL